MDKKRSCFLVFTEKRITRVTIGRPNLSAHERAVRVVISFSDAMFAKTFPSAEIAIPESAIIAPIVTVELPDQPADPSHAGEAE